MTEIEVKQLIERLRQRSNSNYMLMSHPPKPAPDADCHMAADMLQEALAFKQEVSDAVESALLDAEDGATIRNNLGHFIIRKPKPDPLVETLKNMDAVMERLEAWRAALEARGLEIREKGQ